MWAAAMACVMAVVMASSAAAEPDPPPAGKDETAAPPAEAPADKPPETPPKTQEDTPTVADVQVVGERPAVVREIDRQVYDVRKDPDAQSASVSDILGKIPSVTVTPTGGVLLLGQSGVTILVDGKPGSTRALRGADIERIEVMTNPSAQYGPRGTGGIINIITRKDRRQGQTGNVTATVDSLGGGRVSLAPNWVIGRWVVGGNIGVGRQPFDTTGLSLRRQDDGAGGVVGIRVATRYDYLSQDLQGGFKLTFRRNDRQSVYVSAQGFRSEGDTGTDERAVGDSAAFADYVQRGRGPNLYSAVNFNAGYDWTGKREGETFGLSFSASPSVNRYGETSVQDFADPALADVRYRQLTDNDRTEMELKADYKRPLSGDRILSLGAAWTREDETQSQLFETLTAPDPLRDMDRAIHGVRDVTAAYVTYQLPLWSWTVMPGLRLEAEQFEVASGGAFGGSDDLFWYPSLHVSRDFGEAFKLNFSYSRRIDRPALDQLDPVIRYYDTTSAVRGNPDLDPVTTDAWEARLEYGRGSFNLGLTLYDRQASGTLSSRSVLTPEGVRLSTIVNAGESANRGAELSVRGNIAPQWSYVVTTNLFWREQQVLDGGLARADTQFTYSGNAQLSWKAAPAKPDSGDQVQLSLRYLGPTRSFQGESDGFLRADLTWKRPFTKKLTGTLTFSDLLDSSDQQSRVWAEGYEQVSTYQGAGPTVRFSLSYRFGAP